MHALLVKGRHTSSYSCRVEDSLSLLQPALFDSACCLSGKRLCSWTRVRQARLTQTRQCTAIPAAREMTSVATAIRPATTGPPITATTKPCTILCLQKQQSNRPQLGLCQAHLHITVLSKACCLDSSRVKKKQQLGRSKQQTPTTCADSWRLSLIAFKAC